VVRVTIQQAHFDQDLVEHLNVDAQFLQPCPVLKHGVGASAITRKRRILPDECDGGLGHGSAPRLRYN
jgi:hypothetical protein